MKVNTLPASQRRRSLLVLIATTQYAMIASTMVALHPNHVTDAAHALAVRVGLRYLDVLILLSQFLGTNVEWLGQLLPPTNRSMSD